MRVKLNETLVADYEFVAAEENLLGIATITVHFLDLDRNEVDPLQLFKCDLRVLHEETSKVGLELSEEDVADDWALIFYPAQDKVLTEHNYRSALKALHPVLKSRIRDLSTF